MKSVAACAAIAFGLGAVSPVWAQEPEVRPSGPIEAIRATDVGMSCAVVSEEAARLSEAMGGEPGGGLFGRLGGVARAGASMVIP
ncbi:MAG TPA: hypothetical protein PLR59_09715, partial [Brevundimonas sp.]|nr:hypothetical protein [Brevundimonas sp.]